jgi:hypothetical protein
MGSSPLRKILFAVSIAGLALAGLAASAGAGSPLQSPLTVEKVVHGPVPAGTTFTAQIQCDEDIIISGGGTVDSVNVTFDATGQATSQATFGFDDPGECTVTETANGGAETVTYSCVGNPGTPDVVKGAAVASNCAASGPQAEPMTVTIFFNLGEMSTVTIDNTFVDPPPTPAPATVLQPTLPG